MTVDGLTLTHVGGPTALLEIGGLTFLTDPTFDAPGDYRVGGSVLRKTTSPALTAAEVAHVDVVLLSHDQHPDNLDNAGRASLSMAGVVLSTPAAATRISQVVGLAPWQRHDVPRSGGGVLTVTAVPARHGPEGSERILGDVTGFVLSGEDLATVYVSGDNVSTSHVGQVVDRFGSIDVAIVFAGAARIPAIPGPALTLTAEDVETVARMLEPAVVVPVHAEGWSHLSESVDTLSDHLRGRGLGDRLMVPTPGRPMTL